MAFTHLTTAGLALLALLLVAVKCQVIPPHGGDILRPLTFTDGADTAVKGSGGNADGDIGLPVPRGTATLPDPIDLSNTGKGNGQGDVGLPIPGAHPPPAGNPPDPIDLSATRQGDSQGDVGLPIPGSRRAGSTRE